MDVSVEQRLGVLIALAILGCGMFAWQTRKALQANAKLLAILALCSLAVIAGGSVFAGDLVKVGVRLPVTATIVLGSGVLLGLVLSWRTLLTVPRNLAASLNGWRAAKRDPELYRRTRVMQQYDRLLEDLLEQDDLEEIRCRSKVIAKVLTGLPDEDLVPLAEHLCLREVGSLDKVPEVAEFLRSERNLVLEAPGFAARHFERLKRKLETVAIARRA